MQDIAVFAGLGSDVVFSEQSAALAFDDLQGLEARLILRDCFDVFVDEIRIALEDGTISSSSINLQDFRSATALLQPPGSYHRNVILQHVTLYLTQILRYVGHRSKNPSSHAVAATGFCVGILPAAAIAVSPDLASFVLRSRQLFHLALQLGIHSEASRSRLAASRNCRDSEPWSIVVDGISSCQAESLLKTLRVDPDRSTEVDVFVSAVNSERCVTISGRGDDLRHVTSKRLLPVGCRIRKLQIYALYHHRSHLEPTHSRILGRLQQSLTVQALAAAVDFSCPLISPSDGKAYDAAELPSVRGLFTALLDSILLDPVQWVEVERTILAVADASSAKASASPVRLLNFGPGYGFSQSRARTSESLALLDVSAAGVARSDPSSGPVDPTDDDIAIVGMAVDLPDAPDVQTLWDNLTAGRDSCSKIPPSRFHVEDFQADDTDAGNQKPRRLKTQYGNFMRNPFEFDNAFFNVSPREARSMDPQQRVMLQTAYRALEDSGYTPDATPSCSRDTFGAFIGNATLDYPDNLKQDIDVYYSPGTLRAFQSGRISYAFGWSGPSVTLDTACSSSMVAMHQAVRSISAGDCRAALVGGVNVITSPDMYLGLDRAHFLSSTGQCKAFDDSADGYCRSEGCVAFVVKKLSDARAENDAILGIIRGLEINQSGNAHSITHPHAPTQALLFERLLSKTGISPRHVSVAELHGTGTQAGDPEELHSVRMALCKNRSASEKLNLTSIKANIGHCEAASGGASLAKVLLMMKHCSIPAQVSLKHLNPKIGQLGVDGAVIDTVNTPWDSSGRPRLALLNNFGAAGSNAALLIQEYREGRTGASRSDRRLTHHLGISAKGEEALLSLKSELVAFLKAQDPNMLSIEDLCYTYAARRQHYDCRLSVTGASLSELSQALHEATPIKLGPRKSQTPSAVFAFSGQGSQFVGMGADLMSLYPVFSDTVEQCERLLCDMGLTGCLQVIRPTQEFSADDLKHTHVQEAFQVAVYALQVGQARLLQSWGLRPSAVLGHSLGEYAALTVAGVISLKDGLKLVARRAALLMQKCEPFETCMLAVNASKSKVLAIIAAKTQFAELEISCNNSSTDCVVGGPVSALQAFKDQVKNELGIKSKLLDVPVAYHTRAVEPILAELEDIAEGVDIHPPTIPVVSSVLGCTVQPGGHAFDAAYFARHCRETVAFTECVEAARASDSGISAARWLELGPSPSLIPMIKTQCAASETQLLPLLRKGVDASKTLAAILSHFYTCGLDINWRQVYNTASQPKMTSVPVMPFIKKEFLVPCPREGLPLRAFAEAEPPSLPYRFLSKVVQSAAESNGHVAIYEVPLSRLEDLITGHIVVGHALCPASVYHEIALTAVRDSTKSLSSTLTISNVSYHKPLLFVAGSMLNVRVTISPSARSAHSVEFSVSSALEGKQSPATVHCDGLIKIRDAQASLTKHARAGPALQHRRAVFCRETASQQSFFTRVMYEMVFPRVVTYSGIYQTVQCLRMNSDVSEALAQCQLPRESRSEIGVANSILMDSLLHVAGFVANFRAKDGDAYICKEVKTAVVLQDLSDWNGTFEVFCTTHEIPEERSTVSDAYATNKNGVLAVFKGMVFQNVKLAKVSQAFRLLSGRPIAAPDSDRNSSGAARNPPSGSFPRVSAPVPMPEKSLAPAISINVRKMLEDICGASRGSINDQTTLEAMGVDSLLLIELEAQLSASLGSSFDSAALAKCTTVRDVELLTAQLSGVVAVRPTLAEPSSVQLIPRISEPPAAADAFDVSALISETCGADIASITPQASLEALGIDSLMFLELEARLTAVPGIREFSSSALTACQTVGEVQRLLALTPPAEEPSRHSQLPGDKNDLADQNAAEYDSAESHGSSSGYNSVLDEAGTSCSSASSLSALGTPAEDAADNDKLAVNIAALRGLFSLLGHSECIQPGSSTAQGGAPLMLIHDGSGICWHYRRLQGLGRPVHAISDSKLLSARGWRSIPAMADSYTAIVEQTFASTDAPIIGGWSFGGVVAFEVARRLKARGRRVAGVVLIDSPPPIDHQPLSDEIIRAVTSAAQSRGQVNQFSQQIQKLTAQNFARCASLLQAFAPEAADPSLVPRAILLRSREGYKNPSLRGEVNAWLQDRSDARTALDGWEKITGGAVGVVDIPGNHFEVFDSANVATVSARLEEACRKLEA